jgi:hypothetical protein
MFRTRSMRGVDEPNPRCSAPFELIGVSVGIPPQIHAAKYTRGCELQQWNPPRSRGLV